jgi:hypothetical protein
VGQALGLRRPPRPPRAGPCILLRPESQAGYDRVVFDVPPDSPEFLVVANHVVIALVLPEGLAGSLEQNVGLFGGCRFERAEKLRGTHLWNDEGMDVIGHDRPSVQLIVFNLDAALDRGQNQLCNGWLLKKDRAATGMVEQAVQPDESFAGGYIRGRKGTIRGETVMQAEGYEEALAVCVYMGKAAASRGHVSIVWRGRANSRSIGRAAWEAAAGHGPAPQKPTTCASSRLPQSAQSRLPRTRR